MKSLKIKILRTLCLIALMWMTSSCEKVIEPDELPEQDARIVMNAPFYNDSLISVRLSSSKSIVSGKDYKLIEGAYCAVYENDVFLEQLVSKGKGLYLGTKTPQPGKTYKIVARANGYKNVEGISNLPLAPTVTKATLYDTVSNMIYFPVPTTSLQSSFIYGNLKVRAEYKNAAGEKDYFMITAYVLLYDADGEIHREPLYISETNSGFSTNSSFSFSNTLIKTDETVSADNTVVFDLSTFVNINITNYPKIDSADVVVQTGSLSSDLYNYMKTANQQAGQGPRIFAEPTIIYNNISDGMGIVGGMNKGNTSVLLRRRLP